jgi:hypothetical protein
MFRSARPAARHASSTHVCLEQCDVALIEHLDDLFLLGVIAAGRLVLWQTRSIRGRGDASGE